PPWTRGESLPMARLHAGTLAARFFALDCHGLAALDHGLVVALECRLRGRLSTRAQGDHGSDGHRHDCMSHHLIARADVSWAAVVTGRVAIRASSSAR